MTPQRNVGWWVFCVFLSDFLLGVFALLGWEHASGLADYPRLHYLTFTFPYSHGFMATLVWSGAAAVVAFLAWRDIRAAAVAALAVSSHFILDALVHVQGLPLLGEGSAKVGFGLWRNLPLALALEALLVTAGIFLYLRRGFSGRRPVRAWAQAATVALLAVLLLAGQAFGDSAPPAEVLPWMWLGFPVALALLLGWVEPRGSS